MSANPHGFRDGELLPCFGGPLDGEAQSVSVLFPEGYLVALLYAGHGQWYRLDQANRRWVYAANTVKVVKK